MMADGTIAALIVQRPLCLECIAAKVDAPVTAVDEALTRIANLSKISVVARSICRKCLQRRVTYFVDERRGSAR